MAKETRAVQKHEMHGPATIFETENVTFTGEPGNQLARLIGPDVSKTMAVAFGYYDNCAVDWTVKYDEVVYVIDGTFRLVIGGVARNYRPGDVIWIPENTELRYGGEKAKVLFVISPADWRERHGIPAAG